MKVIRTRSEMVEIVRGIKNSGKSLGFVPTMGYLHQGHLSLIASARKDNDVVVVSIFVNPIQFVLGEDFENYPRDFEHDLRLLNSFADYVFFPENNEIYPLEGKISFHLNDIVHSLCGLSRPKHFSGVCLVLAKLFHIIQPTSVYFGQKDYQQTVVVRHLIQELFFEISFHVGPIVRESNGLAMSSRNIHLSLADRALAPFLYKSLLYGLDLCQAGEQNPDVIIQEMKKFLAENAICTIDYIDIRDAVSLAKVKKIGDQTVVLALAVFFGKVRLIDNVLYEINR